MAEDAANKLGGKLLVLRRALSQMQVSEADADPEYEEILEEDIKSTAVRLAMLMKAFGLKEESDLALEIVGSRSTDMLFRIQLAGPWEGEYAVVRGLVDHIDNVLFSYSSGSAGSALPFRYTQALNILRHVTDGYTVSQNYPSSEKDFHEDCEMILICSFPDLVHKPPMSGPVKHFQADSGIPEIRTLIEYKYIADANRVASACEEILADCQGYKTGEWDRIIFVVYETERFKTEDAWRALVSGIPYADIVLLKGIREPSRPKEVE